jgi:hypothetical protein
VHLAAELVGRYRSSGRRHTDYRDLPWAACESLVADYCRQTELPTTAQVFVTQLRSWLDTAAQQTDATYPTNSQLVIDAEGKPILKRSPASVLRPSTKALEAALLSRMLERNLLDILANVAHYTDWPRHFGPLSGSDPKLIGRRDIHILTTLPTV